MFSSSMCRVARAPAVTLPVTTAPRPSTVVLANGLTVTRPSQRRYSSSKPPVPPSDGSRGIDAPSQTPTKSVNPSKKDEVARREGKAAKRKAKDGSASGNKSKQETSLNLPSVPSTQHLHPHDIHVASFFSIHRPMSVTTSVPPNLSQGAFDAIFSPKKQKKYRQNDVIYTLSSAVNIIEGAFAKGQSSSSAESNDLRSAVTQASASNAEPDVTHLDGAPVQDLIQDFTKKLRPFSPPPAPVPMDAAEQSNAMDSEMETDAAPGSKEYSTTLTIRESNHADGSRTYEAYTSPFFRVEDMEAPSGVAEREVNKDQDAAQEFRKQYMQIRRERRRKMYTISVRRQRKLKMKKHKYKKLMRRTRTLRRKLDKA